MKQSRFTPGDIVQVQPAIYYGAQWESMNLSNEIRAYEVYTVSETRYVPHMEKYFVGLKGLYSHYPEDVLIKIVKISNDNKGESHGEEKKV